MHTPKVIFFYALSIDCKKYGNGYLGPDKVKDNGSEIDISRTKKIMRIMDSKKHD